PSMAASTPTPTDATPEPRASSDTPGSPTAPPPEPAVAPATSAVAAASSPAEPSIRYTHSGYRYVLGYGPDHFGIWDRQSPTAPAERFPRTDEGWGQAWTRFGSL